MTIDGVLYTMVLLISFVLIGMCTLICIIAIGLYDAIRRHKRKCDDIEKHISDIYHNPDKKG